MLIAVFGFLIWLLIIFQALLGLRVVKIGKRQRPVHRWIGLAIVVLAPMHGLAASVYFLGFPFRLG
jgi:heme A synthase